MRKLLVVFAAVLVCVGGCNSNTNSKSTAGKPTGQTTLLWLSIDAMRYDYLDRIRPPTLTRLAHEGAYTTNQKSIFPSMTYPNHAAQVTGTYVEKSGIPLNNFLDTSTGKSYVLPGDSSLLRSEPIWITATRQGVRSLVWEWPLSSAQAGEVRSAYFAEKYEGKTQTDAQRIMHVAQIVKDDKASPPLRLIITYMSHVDTDGHKYGPDSPEVVAAVMEADKAVDEYIKVMTAWFDATHSKDDELVVFITTDHGMANVASRVNFEKTVGAALAKNVRFITSGPTGQAYLNNLPEAERAERAKALVEKLGAIPGARVWLARDVPKEFHYSDPTRVGDIVVTLPPHVSWTSRLEGGVSGTQPAGTQPTTRSAAQVATHGWDPAVDPLMRGMSIIWRYRNKIGGKDLGEISNIQWHATAAKVLGIKPAPDANTNAIAIP